MSVNKVQLANGETIIDISDSTVTPETLAEGVIAHDSSGQQITGRMVPGGGGASVQSDWNQTDETAADFIKNKPFGEFPTGGDTLYWDGNIEGLVNSGGMYFKVSDNVLTTDDLANGAICVFPGGAILEVPEEQITDFRSEGIPVIAVSEYAIIALEDNITNFDFPLPEKGIYLINIEGIYVLSLTIPDYTSFPDTKKIDSKYIPDNDVTFYFGESQILYNDVNLTVGTTYLDIMVAANKRVAIIPVFGGEVMNYKIFPAAMYLNDSGYASVNAVFDDKIIALYTVEYTP